MADHFIYVPVKTWLESKRNSGSGAGQQHSKVSSIVVCKIWQKPHRDMCPCEKRLESNRNSKSGAGLLDSKVSYSRA